ncbi:MAG: hypothetical protein R6U68_15280, partial [Desulfobacteraceae bacterium]
VRRSVMPLAQEDYEAIGEYVRQHMGEWLGAQSLAHPPQVYEIELRERMVRVEEELKNQRDLMKQGFEQMDKRFEMMTEQMNKRFEQVDKRFEQVDKRFEQVDKRFEQVDKRFEQINKRFDTFMRWSFGLTLTVGGLVVASLKYLQ